MVLIKSAAYEEKVLQNCLEVEIRCKNSFEDECHCKLEDWNYRM